MPDTSPPSFIHDPIERPGDYERLLGEDGSRERSRKVHFVLQGKGGIGKTFVASLLAQYYRERARSFACLDTDPVNGSLSELQALDARHVALLNGDKIDVDPLDEMIERVRTEDATSSSTPVPRALFRRAVTWSSTASPI